jgi:hypothetical protein
MTTIPASRNQTIPIMTLADVLAAVVVADLPTRRRQEMASAVRTIGRALERPLAELPAHPRLIGPRLRGSWINEPRPRSGPGISRHGQSGTVWWRCARSLISASD